MEIAGVKFAALNCGIKQDKLDLMLAQFVVGTVCAGAFSTSYIVSPTIGWDKNLLKQQINPKALLVNSGNANSFTGQHGHEAITQTTKKLAAALNISQEEVLVSSTGVIGEKLPYDKIIAHYPGLISGLNAKNYAVAAEAIMTTDTAPKLRSVTTDISGQQVKITSFAKGAGMAAPNLATVLSYSFTDAVIGQDLLQQIFAEALEESFNAFTIDGDMSTNDTALIFATQQAGNKELHDINAIELENFKAALKKLLQQICDDIVLGGEGVSKLCKIYVSGAKSKKSAKNVAMAVANSPLVKTALHGSDPNWGRIVMAVGKAKEELNLEKFSLDIGEFNVVKNGELNENYDESNSTGPYMQGELIEYFIDLGVTQEKQQALVTSCDLSRGYIEINADYRT